MTLQLQDRLILNGGRHSVHPECGLPTEHPALRPAPERRIQCTACWRGYVATWEIRTEELWLVELDGDPQLSDGPVLADWFTGTMVVPHGPVIAGLAQYRPIAPRVLRIDVGGGRVTRYRLAPGHQRYPRLVFAADFRITGSDPESGTANQP